MRGRRCTARGRVRAGRGRPPLSVRGGALTAVSAVVVALGLGGVPVGQEAAAAPGAASGTPRPYAFAEGARTVDGALSTADAVRLEIGPAHRSTLPSNGRVHYSLELDAASNAYVSATAVPPAGGTGSVSDGIKVSLKDDDGRSCDADTATFGAARSPHPLAASAVREIASTRSLCQQPGTYYLTVERADPDGAGSSPGPWELELTAVTEPPLEGTAATEEPEDWDSASPAPVAGEPRRRAGGAGFARATTLGEGAWRDDIRPGQTLFYRVPVDWGGRIHATAELGSSRSGGRGFVPAALDLDLYNPVRGRVTDLGIGYDGNQKSDGLDPLPPVAHANRHAVSSRVKAMRFAGSYYLVAHLAAGVADDFGDGPVGLTLRIRVGGAAQSGPRYAGEPVPAEVFTVTEEDRETAAGGDAADDRTAMTALAVGGIGTGSALLVGLGVWTVLARRRAVP
ncbi:hypothetical protein ACFYOV_05905 [Streptomyces sp. NPDC005931]|uniref:hypothetical protein n=1 Tax=Streptomyces sp. NPDC005931 TaxID=3364737 RepID=UPI00367F0F5C